MNGRSLKSVNAVHDHLWQARLRIQEVMDFAFGFPLTMLAAIWFWRRLPWGYVLAGAFLVYGVIEAISVTIDQTFGHISDPTQSLAMVPIFAGLTVIAFVPTIVYLHYFRQSEEQASSI